MSETSERRLRRRKVDNERCCRFIISPNLPISAVNTAMVGEGNPEISRELAELGINPLLLKRNKALPDEVSTHADMLLAYFGDGKFVFSQKDDIIKQIEAFGADSVVINRPLKPEYPTDIALNCTVLGNRLFGLQKFLADEVKMLANESNLTVINSKQGYSKCSMCIVNENAVITEDSGITCLLNNSQIDVLKVKGDCIKLSNKHYGFLGGCSGKIAPDKLYFNGDLSRHPDYKPIIEFLNKHSVKPVFNASRELTDVGGIIPIIEFA